MRILVTGGAGFIGSHIAEAALVAGHEVAVIDDLSAGRRENVPKGASFYELDICDAAGVGRVFDAFRPEAVSHQAAQASVTKSVRDPLRDAQVNIVGSLNLVLEARKHVSRVVFASTGGRNLRGGAGRTACVLGVPLGAHESLRVLEALV